MIGNLNPQQIAFFAILIIALVLFVTEWIRTDVVAVLVVIALYVTRVLKPDEALSGFSSEPAIVIAGIFVLSGAMHATGLSDRMGDWIGRFAGKSLTRAIAVILPSVALLSAFTHHVTTTAVMLPVTLQQSGRSGLPIFSIAPIGLSLSLVGTIFILLIGRFLLPTHRGSEDRTNHFRLEDYLTEIVVTAESPLLDRTIAEVEDDEKYHFR